MVIKGKIRGGGRQLASYLLAQGENEAIRILDVDGQRNFDQQDLRDLLGDFSLNERLTRSRQGLYHASINPSEEDAAELTDAQWRQAADILAAELNFSEQRRALVLHRKGGRVHCHVVFERYDHGKQKMIPVDFNYKRHDKARAKMEQVFQHQPTPERNLRRPMMKKELSRLWHDCEDGKAFVKAARESGYAIVRKEGRAPFWVIDDTGRSFNLVRQLDGCKLKEARDRLGSVTLMDEKKAIALIRTKQALAAERPEDQERQEWIENMEKLRNKQRMHQPRMH
jgi:hypothetical protein